MKHVVQQLGEVKRDYYWLKCRWDNLTEKIIRDQKSKLVEFNFLAWTITIKRR